MKKKILIAVGIVVAVIAGIIAAVVVSDLKQEDKLKDEMVYIDELVNSENADMDKVEKALARTVTKGDYKTVEKAYKSHLSDCFDNILKISEILNDERIAGCLTAENYASDGPDFIKTKEYLQTTKAQLEEYKNRYSEFFTEEKAMSYINNSGLDSYYTDLYKDEILGDIESENEDKTVENSLDDVINMLDASEKVISFLSENKNSWSLENGHIVFSTDSLSNKYSELTAELQ